ncbi:MULTISPECIES: hypothetical protein [Corynebacterium]|nr:MULTISPECIES: hypothetical protein [Corynebacterium]MDN8595240.1 hypothetical protein [Corynebacterium sp. P4_F2]WKK62775.1 hypothetical protein QYR04_07940 [Corynebacterium sp. P8-C1]
MTASVIAAEVNTDVSDVGTGRKNRTVEQVRDWGEMHLCPVLTSHPT